MIVASFRICGGINNRDPQYRLSVGEKRYDVLEATNVDIYNSGAIKKRSSLTQLYSGSYSYLYKFKNMLCYVKDNVFYLDGNNIIPIVGEVSYTTDKEYLFVMDNNSIYKIDERGQYTDLTTVEQQDRYFHPPVPGHKITYSLGRLFIARNNRILYTLPFRYSLVDMRNNIAYLPSYIKMLKGVDRGIYIADTERVYFMQPAERGFSLSPVVEGKVFEGSDIDVDMSLIATKVDGRGLLFIVDGILYLGSPTGEVVSLTPQYKFSEGSSATIREENGLYQYIYC
jgi:hypothetical protein